MDKPVPITMKPAFNYNQVIDYIEDKHGINVRDYAGRHSTGIYDDSKPYLDFWHWILEETSNSIHNECYAYIPVDYKKSGEFWGYDINDEERFPYWVKEILDIIHAEFSDGLDEEGNMYVWIEW